MLVHADHRGIFDGPTTAGLDLSGPLVVLDLSALYNSAALGVLMACATAWLQATLARQADCDGPGGIHTLVVVDEAWAVSGKLRVRQSHVCASGPKAPLADRRPRRSARAI
ncbi:MAG: hypothetical protein ACLP62_06140 [Acidimicrobiales bacterium]